MASISLRSAAAPFTNQFWVSANSETVGLGTPSEPFDGSTADKFDLVMSNMPPNCTIHLLVGTFQTKGFHEGQPGWTVKTGQKILGSGMDATILRILTNAAPGQVILSEPGTNMVVSDLTVDSAGACTHGICLVGSMATIKRVKAINFGQGAPDEIFTVMIIAPTGTDSRGNLISGCIVSNYLGRGVSAICMATDPQSTKESSITGVIRGNTICLSNSESSGSFGKAAINIGGVNMLIEGNYVDGASVGVYSEASDPNLVIANNELRNVDAGIRFIIKPQRNVTFYHNTVALASNSLRGYTTVFDLDNANGSGVNQVPVTITNIVIYGNTMKFDGLQTGGQAYNLFAGNINGLTMCNNSIDSGMINLIIDCTNVNISNNTDLLGNTLTIP